MQLADAKTVIDNFLHYPLKHTGVTGFEGFVSILLQHATGQEFRLSSSGRQSGRDSSSASGYGNNIKIEAKHYARTTALDLRELLSEIDEAADTDEDLDIWALATSRSVDEQIEKSLSEHAERYGIDTLLLDVGLNGLPRLAVLMAACPEQVINWAGRNSVQFDIEHLRAALVTIAGDPDFEPTRGRLLNKLGATVGYDSARRRIHKRLIAIVSDKNNARSEFRQSLDRKVEICGSALFHALFRNSFPEVALRGLIRYWLGLRNWAETAQLAMTSYVLRRPTTFIEIADEFWSCTRDNGAAREFLGSAFASNRDDPKIQPALARAIERWMGFVHPLGHRFWLFDQARNEKVRIIAERQAGHRVELAADEARNEERVRTAIEDRAGVPMEPGEIEVAGIKLTVVSDGYFLRLARLGTFDELQLNRAVE